MPTGKSGWPVNNHFRLSTGNADYTNVSTKPVVVYGIQAFNHSTGVVAHLKLYDISTGISSVTSTGGTLPTGQWAIPAAISASTAALGAGFAVGFPGGIDFRSGLSYAITTGSSANSTAGVATEAISLNIQYCGS